MIPIRREGKIVQIARANYQLESVEHMGSINVVEDLLLRMK